MSEEQRITKVEKEKDPRRVEAGKKLAAISREAKEKKAKQRAEAEKAHTEEETKQSDDSTSSAGAGSGEGLLDRSAALLTIISVVSGVVCLYFAYRQNSRAEKEMSTEKTVSTSLTSTPLVEEKQQTKSKPKMLSFGD